MDARREELLAAARRLHDQRLAIGTSANISSCDGDTVLITPSGSRMATVTADQLVTLSKKGEPLDGGRPSSETPFHLRIYEELGAGAVVHTHGHDAIVVSTLVDELPVVHYAMADLGFPLRVAPYATFGTDALAAHVLTALGDNVAALMANHGAVTIGATVAEAVERAELLEWSCALVRDALAAGRPRTLDAGDVAAYRRQKADLAYGVRA